MSVSTFLNIYLFVVLFVTVPAELEKCFYFIKQLLRVSGGHVYERFLFFSNIRQLFRILKQLQKEPGLSPPEELIRFSQLMNY